MTKVYIADVSKLNIDLTTYKNSVSQYRYSKTEGLKNEIQKKLSIGAELLLSEYLGRSPKYCIEKFGKPCGEEIEFNFSHSGCIAICAVSDFPIGADVEKIRNINMNIAKKKFCPEEYQVISTSSNPQESFFEYWVKKESYLKALGTGLRIPLNEFDVTKINDWQFYTYDIEGYKICVCAKEKPEFVLKK